jgi:asparagine synthase (glutamine-hydrolysing)
MCGITGIYNLNNEKIGEGSLQAMNSAVAHRGPDGAGYWIHDKGFIGFGHRRLSILDLSERGKQPMSYASGRYHITYNGEIFNFIEIRAQLRSLGYEFRSDTDTEVILAAYDYWGRECLHHFNGMWAFVIWDEKEQELFAARDHFGIKPLYYLLEPGKRFIFGSETIQFKHLSGFRRTFDENQLIACIRNPYYQEGAGRTIFSGIRSVLPGHYLLLKEGTVSEKRWWFTTDYPIEVPEKYTDQVEAFRELFFDSCRLRMRSDVPIASALSGGLDSSSVYTTLHYLNRREQDTPVVRLPSEWQKAFVAIFPDTAQDETAYAQSVVNHVEGQAVYWEQATNDLIADLVQYTRHFDAVYATPIHVVAKVYEGMRQQGIVVSMDGHGIDEMMYGYGGLQLDAAVHALAQGDHDYADMLVETYINLHSEPQRAIARRNAQRKVFGLASIADPGIHVPAWKVLGSRIKRRIFPKKNWLVRSGAEQVPFEIGQYIPFEATCERSLYEQFHYAPLPSILRNFDKASMMSGVEIRMPFMDHRLVSFVFKLPLRSKLGDGYTKRILRDAMKDILPETVRTRTTKIGFSAPLNEWFAGPLKSYLLDTVNTKSFREMGLWNGKLIAKDVELYFNKVKHINISMLWNIINAHIISQNNLK